MWKLENWKIWKMSINWCVLIKYLSELNIAQKYQIKAEIKTNKQTKKTDAFHTPAGTRSGSLPHPGHLVAITRCWGNKGHLG